MTSSQRPIAQELRDLFTPFRLWVAVLACIAMATGSASAQVVLPPSGTISTLAGNGTAGYSGDGGLATNAELNGPGETAVDASGNIYIADTGNNVIREVTAATGIIHTVVGNGTAGYSGDGAGHER